MPKKFSGTGKDDSFFEKIPNLKNAFGFEEKTAPQKDRFFSRILKLFSQTSSPSLRGRVEEMLPKIDTIHNKLKKIKKEASSENELSDEIKAFIDLILEPLIDQGMELKGKRGTKDPLNQVKVVDLYQIWVERAEFWVESYHKESQEGFCRVVNEHIWKDFSLKVERDLKIIEDYIEHAVGALLISDLDKKQMKISIRESVAEHVLLLANLKRLPKEITFRELDEWNRSIDAGRQLHFEASLALIDKEIEMARPHTSLDEHQHLLDLIGMINSIEEQMLILKHRIGFLDPAEEEMESVQQKARFLAEEVHRLSLDLRLPPQIVDRLENLEATLKEIID